MSKRTMVPAAAALALFALLGWPAPAPAAESDAALVERVRDAVIQELRESGELDREVDAGIDRAIARQRAAAQHRQAQAQQAGAHNVRPVDPARDHVYGNPQAAVSLIEYSDFECPFCKRFHPTAKQLVDESGGRVNWVYRHFPLGFHNPAAQREAEASECAAELGGNDAFWGYSDLLFAATPSKGDGVAAAQLIALAGQLGIAAEPFRNCLDSGRYTARVQEDFTEGGAIGITGTPGNLLRNNATGTVLNRAGARPLEQMKAAVEKLLR